MRIATWRAMVMGTATVTATAIAALHPHLFQPCTNLHYSNCLCRSKSTFLPPLVLPTGRRAAGWRRASRCWERLFLLPAALFASPRPFSPLTWTAFAPSHLRSHFTYACPAHPRSHFTHVRLSPSRLPLHAICSRPSTRPPTPLVLTSYQLLPTVRQSLFTWLLQCSLLTLR
jgi:hypothetical protein